MNDLRTQLPQCPLEYQVPHIPGSHTALVIEVNAADIDWQEKMLPWTLAGLINNTDLIMKGVHLYVACEDNLRDRIRTALKKFDLPPGTIISKDEDNKPLIVFGEYGYRYDSVCLFDINYWAFRGIGKAQDRADIKLPLGHVLRHTYGWAVADVSLHHKNDISLKDTWVRMSKPLHLTGGDSPEQRKKLAGALIEASERAHWLHAANTAVYGENYKKQSKNVAAYFFNEVEANWHIDASILHYSAREVNTYFAEWAAEWQHLGTEALIALYLLKTEQHAYNLQDSVMIEQLYVREAYPRLCNMQFANKKKFNRAMNELRGAQLNINMN
ncbi:hypothetical protein C6503_19175 [Candidatus Poribacteria bacterium]|nr:MAG: hypothetical protein C6503_19175 [Candidatus Poribacteria bacterium]